MPCDAADFVDPTPEVEHKTAQVPRLPLEYHVLEVVTVSNARPKSSARCSRSRRCKMLRKWRSIP